MQDRSDDYLTLGVLCPELFIGVVSTVTASTVRVNLSDAGQPSAAHLAGSRYGCGEVGELVLIEGQTSLLLGRIIAVRLPERERGRIGQVPGLTYSIDAVGEVQLLGSVAMDSLAVTAGVTLYPRLGDRVYAAPHRLVSRLPSLMKSESGAPDRIFLNIGYVGGSSSARVEIPPEKLFGRHCAILGSTGAGKSWTVSRILEECLALHSKVILIDATGEYSTFPSEHVCHTHLGTPVRAAVGSVQHSLPPDSFLESDFLALFEPSGKVQGPKLRAAIRSLRLAALRPDLATDGLLIKRMKPRAPFEAAESAPGVAAILDDPKRPFDFRLLSRQVELECVWPTGRPESNWGDVAQGDVAYCLALMTRINLILGSPEFRPILDENIPSLTKTIDEFHRSDARLLRICLSGIAYEYRAREIVANVIGRSLLTRARQDEYRSAPVLLVVDEAHNFLGRHLGSEDFASRLDAFEIIAKEGRKYGLNICLATQRPRDIPEGVLSQMGTLIVHRLTNDRDRELVERACGEIDRTASSFLPNLKPGEAAIIGVDFSVPMTIQVRPPSVSPVSDGPNYQEAWAAADRNRGLPLIGSVAVGEPLSRDGIQSTENVIEPSSPPSRETGIVGRDG